MNSKVFNIVLIAALIGFFGFVLVFKNGSDDPGEANNDAAASFMPSDIVAQVQAGTADFLDVRTPVEYDLDHAITSTNYNVELLKDGFLPDIEKDRLIYVYCRSGNRSAQAKEILDKAGFTNVVDLGGIGSWTDAGGELVQSELGDYREILDQLGKQPIAALGPDDADVTMVKYSDFSCPFCARYTTETEPQIRQKFINGDKTVRYEYRNYSYLGDESALTASGGYCANEQDLFWQYHDAITAGFVQYGPDFYSQANLAGVISTVGGDSQEFNECLDSGIYDVVVSAEALEAKNSGIESTPSFRIGEQVIQGALPYGTFEAAIKAQL